MATLLQARRAYDHRLRDHVCQDRPLAQLRELKIPRSTVASWRSRGPRPVVTIEEFGQDRQLLLDRIEKLKRVQIPYCSIIPRTLDSWLAIDNT